MSLTYVIPDIHGRFDLLSETLHRVHARAAGNGGTLVLLGDYVDKGPQTNMVLARLRRGMPSPWTFIALKGNHDAMMAAGLRDPGKMTHWLERGGDTATASYGGDYRLIPEADVAWIEARPLIHVDAHRIYVHAGSDCDATLEAQQESTLLWKRYPKGDAAGFEGRHIVHGHNAFAAGPELYGGRTNLDTQAWRTGRLVTGVFDDGVPGGPVDFIGVQGPPQDR